MSTQTTAIRSPGPCLPDHDVPAGDRLIDAKTIDFEDPIAPEQVAVRMSDGYSVLVTRYRSQRQAPRAIVVLNHGIQSHAGWFEATSRDLATLGFDVWFADRRGSGQNQSQRGHVRGAGRLLEDVHQIVLVARAVSPNLPVIMGGLCWGGKIAAAAAADDCIPTDAMLLLYPGLFQRIRGKLGDRIKLHVGRFLGASKRTVPLPLPESLFTHNPNWQQFIRDDQLTLREISVGSLFAARELDRLRPPNQISCPTLILLAGDDAIVHNRKVIRWARRLHGPSKTITYDRVAHVLEFETIRALTVAEVDRWATEFVGPASTD